MQLQKALNSLSQPVFMSLGRPVSDPHTLMESPGWGCVTPTEWLGFLLLHCQPGFEERGI